MLNSLKLNTMNTIVNATIEILKGFAKSNNTLFDVMDCSRYGWFGFSFETDRFGGSYLNLSIWENGEIKNTENQQILTIPEIANMVPTLKNEALKNRNLQLIDELINAEY